MVTCIDSFLLVQSPLNFASEWNQPKDIPYCPSMLTLLVTVPLYSPKHQPQVFQALVFL